MKDSYSFDRDGASLDVSFDRHQQAYTTIFERCGLDVYYVEAESGIMGGKESFGFLAPTGSGENELMRCENGDTSRTSRRRAACRGSEFPAKLTTPEEVETPGVTLIEALSEFLGVDPAATSKAMPVVTETRSCSGLSAATTGSARRSSRPCSRLRSARRREDEIRATFGADGGSVGPVNIDVDVIADETLREGQFVAGTNRDGRHLRGVEAGRDYEPTFADIRQAVDGGDACPNCGGRLIVQTACWWTHLQARHVLLRAVRREVPRRGRPRAAARYGELRNRPRAGDRGVVEQHHDEQGIKWPRSVSPVRRPRRCVARSRRAGCEVAEALHAHDHDVLLE